MIHAQNGVDRILLAPDRAAATAVRTANLDTSGADYATIRVNLSSAANTNATSATIGLLHSDDEVATNFATVTANQTVASTSASSVRYEVDTRALKRYLRLSVTPATTSNDPITVSAIATLSRNAEQPGSTTDMGANTVVIV